MKTLFLFIPANLLKKLDFKDKLDETKVTIKQRQIEIIFGQRRMMRIG